MPLEEFFELKRLQRGKTDNFVSQSKEAQYDSLDIVDDEELNRQRALSNRLKSNVSHKNLGQATVYNFKMKKKVDEIFA